MTEDEARKKWCPFTRNGNAAGCNRIGDAERPFDTCIASDCMAWRWKGTTVVDDGTRSSTGFCGLAGEPS